MRKRSTLTTLIGALLLVAAAPLALAQPPGGPRGPRGPERDAGRLFEFLGLTEEQRAAWREVHQQHFEALRPTFEEIRELREQMRAELEGGAPDAAIVGGYAISIHQLEQELRASRGELENALLAILDAEQEQKLEAWKAAHGGRRGHGPGPGGPGGPGGQGPRHGHPGGGGSGAGR